MLLPQSESSAATLILVSNSQTSSVMYKTILSCLFMIEKYGANNVQQVIVVAQLLL